jgi:hypothetical protein
MKSSCISYPEDEPLVLIRTSQLSLCDGNHCAAALLAFFEYWHNIKLGHQQQAGHLNRVAEMHGEPGNQDTSLYQYHNETDIEAGLLHLYGRKMIRQALAILVQKQFVSIHQNPTQRYRFDKTHYFLFHPEEVRLQLVDISHEAKVPHRQGENASPCGTFASPCGTFAATRPEITPEITPENEPPLPSGVPPAMDKKSNSAPKSKLRKPSTQGSHEVPDDFLITNAMHLWARDKCPHIDLEYQTELFRNHVFLKPHTDWGKAWRTWILRAANEFAPRNGSTPAQTSTKRRNDLQAWAVAKQGTKEAFDA